ncbi:MAG TPA: SDR family NAD(P)-dependent oxidoreductase [Candidatus Polarisedimenticolia bacterium]|nr:SDR family NAD(P)-dependent oxidoreductase [Candidatus Polarisedimenticolia bacterium]
MRLQDRIALITGGASGIGLATALAFVREGARVLITDLSAERGAAAVDRARAEGVDLAFRQGDVSRDSEARAMVEEGLRRFGRIDVLFNNAGLLIEKPLHELSEAEWDRTLEVNLKGVFLVSRHVLPGMMRQGGGVIINTGSVNSLVGDYGDPAYCASKGGVGLLTKAMALDYARHNIRVNAICPGWVDTGMFAQEAASRNLTLEGYRRRAAEQEPIGRIARPEEVASLVVFLASADSSFMTGSLVVIDGGLTAI